MFNKLKQVKDLRDQAKTMQSALGEITVEGSGGWGKVKLTMDGNQHVQSVEVDEALLQTSEKKKLESAFKDAVNDAVKKAQRKMAEKMKLVEETRKDSVVILDVPLLIESGMHKGISDVILVYIPEKLQLERLVARDHISIKDATARIKSQMPIDEKKNYASFIIDNSKSIDETKKRTIEVFRDIMKKRDMPNI